MARTGGVHLHISFIHLLVTFVELMLVWIPAKFIAANFVGRSSLADAVFGVL